VTFPLDETTPAEMTELLAAMRRGQTFLTWRDGERAQQLLVLGRDRVTVGREDRSDVPLLWDPEASRLHALLEYLGGSWTVVDDGMSRNGTFVNGARVRSRHRLNDGDVIRFGSTDVLFRDPSSATRETVPAASAGGHAGLAVTPAQRRVLLVLCRPLLEPADVAGALPSNREIAKDLTVSVEAVRSHMKALFKLFEVPELPPNRKRAELARRAIGAGIVTLRDLTG
jgi:FHA domain